MTVVPLADISGDNAAHQLSATGIQFRGAKISATGGVLRLGDSTVSATKGANIAQNTSATIDIDGADPQQFYWTTQVYVYVPSGATASITLLCP